MKKALYFLTVLLAIPCFGQTTKEEYVESGLKKAENQNYAEAIALYDKALAIDPKLTAAYIDRADVYYDQKEYGKALSDISQVLQLNPKHAVAYNNRGMIYKQQKKYNEALADYNKAISLDKNYLMAYINKVRALLLLNKPDDAKATVTNLKKEMPHSADTYLTAYIYYTETGDSGGALSELNTAVAIDPKSEKALLERARFKDEINDEKGAIEDYTALIALNPKDAQYFYGRSSANYDLKNYEKVIEDCNRAIALNSEHYSAHTMLGDVYDTFGQRDTSIINYEAAISIRPDNEYAYNELSKVYYSKKEYAKCIEVLDRILLRKPNTISSLEFRAGAKSYLPDLKGAIADFNKLIALTPDNYYHYMNKAQAEFDNKDNTAACEDMKKAANMIKTKTSEDYSFAHVFIYKNCRNTIDPKLLKVDDLYEEAIPLFNDHKIDMVINKYDEMIKIVPDSSFLFYNRGKMKRMLEKHEDAISDYKKAVQFDKKNVEAWTAMGVSYSYLMQTDNAIKSYLEAIKANPSYAIPYNNLAQFYRGKDNDKAIQYLKLAVEKDPNYTVAYFSLGELYIETGDKERACYNFKRAQALGDSRARIKIISECGD